MKTKLERKQGKGKATGIKNQRNERTRDDIQISAVRGAEAIECEENGPSSSSVKRKIWQEQQIHEPRGKDEYGTRREREKGSDFSKKLTKIDMGCVI